MVRGLKTKAVKIMLFSSVSRCADIVCVGAVSTVRPIYSIIPIEKMPFHRKSTDDWPCFVSVLSLVRSSHVHQYSRLARICQDFLAKFFFSLSNPGAGCGGVRQNPGNARVLLDRPFLAFPRKILVQFLHPVQNQSVDFTRSLVVGTVAGVGN